MTLEFINPKHYSSPAAWRVLDGAAELCQQVRACGVRVGLVKNFDLRLRRILLELGLLQQVDHLVVSAEVGVEKPAELIYELAMSELLGDDKDHPQRVLHVGDDVLLDCWAAEQAGCEVVLWGAEIRDYGALATKALEPSGE